MPRFAWLAPLAIWGGATLLMAVIGPFSTFSTFGFEDRLGYWGVVIGFAICLGVALRAAVARLRGTEGFATDLATAAAQGVGIGTAIWLLNRDVYGFEVVGIGWALYHVWIVYLVCVGIALGREQRRRTLDRRRPVSRVATLGPSPADIDAPNPGPPRPEFLQRLESPLAGRVTRVSADDHYLMIFTPEGSGRVLMRFRDALADLEALPGYRIHRSHWVAEETLVRVRLEGRRYVADLRCGTVLPVSQAHVHTLRQAGFLD